MITICASDRSQPEKTYIFQVLFGVLLELDYRIAWTTVAAETIDGHPAVQLLLPNGAHVYIEDHFFSKFEENQYYRPENIPETAPSIPHPFRPSEMLTIIFGRKFHVLEKQNAYCGIDLFAAAFFMLSRWEEYANPVRDAHGRFPGSASLAVRSGFMDRPIVQEYAELLRDYFETLGWSLPPLRRKFTVIPTYDVDTPRLWWSPTDRLRTLAGSLFQRRDLKELVYWIRGPIWSQQDPNDTFDELMALSEQNGHTAYFNFLGQRSQKSDCYYPLKHPFIENLIQKIVKRGHVAGFHTSYEGHDHPELLETEIASLKKIFANIDNNPDRHLKSGRQHYLRFAAPHTWQIWANHGFEWDSTLGYSDAEGFRCGICIGYPVFNFLTRKMLPLYERPLIAMDVTLALYKGYTPEYASSVLQKLRETVQKHQGEFVVLWHNSSWNTAFWEKWKPVWREAIRQI